MAPKRASVIQACLFGCLLALSAADERSNREKRAAHKILRGPPMMKSGRSANGACSPPASPKGGQSECVTNSDDFICTATCLPGYKFETSDGPEVKIICDQFYGDWLDNKGSFPDCVPICKKLIAPKNGQIRCESDASETRCYPSCDSGYAFESRTDSIYRCQTTVGAWSPSMTIPGCKPEVTVIPTHPPTASPAPTGSRVHPTGSGEGWCGVWSQNHYRTFDNKVFSFEGRCTYVLAKDCVDNTFTIQVTNDRKCDGTAPCKREIDIYVGESKLSFRRDVDGRKVIYNEKVLTVPTSEDGIVIQEVSQYLYIRTNLGFNVKWDGMAGIFVEVGAILKGKTCGLCGVYNDDPTDDFTALGGKVMQSAHGFAHTWKMEDLSGIICPDTIGQHKCNPNTAPHAAKECSTLRDPAFSACHMLLSPEGYVKACEVDYCTCDGSRKDCVCNSFEAFFRACQKVGVNLSWRGQDRCPVSCPNNLVYKECGSSCPKSCDQTTYNCMDEHCVDGCHCPNGMVLNGDRCVAAQDCPCPHPHTKKLYTTGERIKKDCNTCTCKGGSWECSKKKKVPTATLR